ncbi:MAG: terminase large subunit [Bacillota bacterium]|jgi:phage terminase large subunit-like protein
MTNPIREYWEKIENGDVVVCEKIKRTFRKLNADLENKASVYYYSESRGQHVIDFAERFCRHSKGKYGGQLVRLELWEKAILAAIFGFVDIEGSRKYREAILIVGKKNGKSLLSSIVGLYLLVADGEPGPEIYAVATKKDQAKIIWTEAKRMVNKSPTLRKRIKPLVASMEVGFNDGTFRPLASDSDTLDGLNIHGGLMDEIHQWKNGRALFDIIYDGTTAREQPLIFITSTAGTIREDLFDDKYDEARRVIDGYGDPDGYHDDHFIAFIYELDKRSEWENPACWVKANPGLGTIKSREQLAEKVRKAQENPMLVKNLVCKEFNIPETSSEAWLTREDILNPETFDLAELKPRYGIGGADLSSTTDLTAAKVIFMVPNDPRIYVESMYWLPEESIEKRTREDKIPYDKWVERGLMRTSPGNKIHPKVVTEWFLEIQQEKDIYLPFIGYDSWSAVYWVEEMKAYFGKAALIPVHQGKKTLSAPMKALGEDLKSKLIIYNDNPIDKWCLYNTAYEEDKNGNIQPHKTSRSTRRIDGTAALLNAYTVLMDHRDEYMMMI